VSSTLQIAHVGRDMADRLSGKALHTDLLTVAEVAGLLKVPVSWVYEHTRRRGLDRIPHFKLGKYLRFSEREVLDWLLQARET
jgi:excisionase family DNA binding protein